ncbi:uncharacterized protein [Elaeis guineensis]|uniref:Uncharacterized protein LOC105046047 n=1 Tax=Elaeis guineensis var. tenera TaxID=51953 RepID=A0A6I9RA28_ELAGV|nr:uncharacterized protein LOC105046047 [Elaeis guineensis]
MGKGKLKLTLHLILTLTLLFTTPLPTKGAFAATQYMLPANTVEYRPIDRAVAVDGDGNRRELTPFQLCLDCRCCAANDPNNCSSMPCCFGIDCNLPEKPFGVCAFVPKTCNCTSCS